MKGMAANLSGEPSDDHDLSRQERDDISAFFQAEYWKRTWIIQELTLARQVHVLTSDHSLPWAVVRIFLYHNKWHLPLLHSDKGNFSWSERNFERANGDLNSFFELILDCYRSHCSDPRDKVYGLRALMTETMQAKIPVDYSLSTKDVFVMAGEALIDHVVTHHNDVQHLVVRLPWSLSHLGSEMLLCELASRQRLARDWFEIAIENREPGMPSTMIPQAPRSQYLALFKKLVGKEP
jgi:hypothetical protein